MNKAHIEAITIALKALDFENDADWTSDDLPRLDVVSGHAGIRVNREMVQEVAPDFSRKTQEYFSGEGADEKDPDAPEDANEQEDSAGETQEESSEQDSQEPEADVDDDDDNSSETPVGSAGEETAAETVAKIVKESGFIGAVKLVRKNIDVDAAEEYTPEDLNDLTAIVSELEKVAAKQLREASEKQKAVTDLSDALITLKENGPQRSFAHDIKRFQKQQQAQREKTAVKAGRVKEILDSIQ